MLQKITKLLSSTSFLLIVLAAHSQTKLSYVNPLIGTTSATTVAALKHGEGSEQSANTIPAVTLPFAMTQWVAQTRLGEPKCLPPYSYKDISCSGFRGTHWISGGCMQDYGSVTIMPVTGNLHTSVADYQTTFSHTQETTSPSYYSVELTRYSIKAEMTATLRCGLLQFTINKDDSVYLLITPNSDKEKGFIKIDKENHQIVGYSPVYRIYQGWGQPAGFSGYFVIQTDQDFGIGGVFAGEKVVLSDTMSNQQNVGAFIGTKVKKGTVVRVKIGTSFTSIEEARKNLETEIKGFDFAATRLAAENTWEKALSQVSIQTPSIAEKHIFYTALYHAMQHPRLFNDADGTYPMFSSYYKNAKLASGNYYDDFSMWDVYRAQLPLYEILRPTLINDCVSSLILKAQQGGWMPIFPCWNSYTSEMVGDHSTVVIASALLKGIKNYDVQEAYQLIRKNAFETPASYADYKEGKGRRALTSYLQYGYIPLEDSVQEAYHKKEQVSRTLEYAYDDYALAKVAQKLGKTEDYTTLIKRSENYKNVYDANVGFMNGRYQEGSWYKKFNPDKKSFFITEGTPRQYTFYVPHDIKGLAAIMGGTKQLENQLDSVFQKGEYWHGNEPGQQTPFMYNFTASPYKTQLQVNKILTEEYADGPGGLCGNDDAGQISAWYVFAALGLYPVNPASTQYCLTTPRFETAVLNLPSGKQFKVVAHKKSKDAIYIQSVKLNGVAYNKSYIEHGDIVKGGVLEIIVSDTPNRKWASNEDNRPASISDKK
ncbi:GH92 family glycosyl hydrolase [Parasediminibacterium sp. JCM 36343]|uniref:GH92 family glycosyl hydrolase n=1 Tax=Parasediminibacterium sp. JCM 36343 TaxID=3374279 RepID=UPI0039788CB8